MYTKRDAQSRSNPIQRWLSLIRGGGKNRGWGAGLYARYAISEWNMTTRMIVKPRRLVSARLVLDEIDVCEFTLGHPSLYAPAA